MKNQEFVDAVMKAAGIRVGPGDVNDRKVCVTKSFACYSSPSITAIEFEGSPPRFQVVLFSEDIFQPVYVDGRMIRAGARNLKIHKLVAEFLNDIAPKQK